jgi:hypothetical protein
MHTTCIIDERYAMGALKPRMEDFVLYQQPMAGLVRLGRERMDLTAAGIKLEY